MKKSLMFVMALLVCNIAQGQLYTAVVESGDSLISSTADTTEKFMLYSGSKDDRRPIRPTLLIDVDEIGTNTTHYWMNIRLYITDDGTLAKESDGWCLVRSFNYTDIAGVSSTNQSDFSLPLTFLDAYAGYYARLVLSFPRGEAADSTAYEIVFMADKSGNMYAQPFNGVKHINHRDLFDTATKQTINGLDSVSTKFIDTRIETSPGNYQLADRVMFTVDGITKIDDDSLTIYVYGVSDYGLTGGVRLDTLTVPLSLTAAGLSSFSLTIPGGATVIPQLLMMRFLGEAASAADTSSFYANLTLECDP